MQRTDDGHLQYSPSDLIVFMVSPFASWMDRGYLEDRTALTPDGDDPLALILAEEGTAHETRTLEALRTRSRVAVVERGGDAARVTLEAMRRGDDVIYQARLQAGEFAGYADFLHRTPGASMLGDYHYEVADTKLARSPKPTYLIQLAAYAEMLEAVQGLRPGRLQVVLGDGSVTAFRTDDVFYFYQELKTDFLGLMARYTATGTAPEPLPGANHGRWTSHADRWFEERDHLSRVAGLTKHQVKRLGTAGIATMTALAATTLTRVAGIGDETFARLREQAALQRASGEKVQLRILTPLAGARRGLALLPPPSPDDVSLDLEGYPLIADGLEYLFGMIAPGGAYEIGWAHDRPGERARFESTVDRLHALWKKTPSMHIYHYAPYEVSAFKRLAGRYATCEEELDELLRNEVFVDVYEIVRHGVRAGTRGYSLKDLEILHGFTRSGSVAGGGDSITAYHRWLSTRDESVLGSIAAYNEADCRSLASLVAWLRDRQREAAIVHVAPPPPGASERVEHRREANATLIPALLAQAQPHSELLAQLLEFHHREERPRWWALFRWHEMSEEELIDDVDCLGGLAFEARRGPVASYTYDPDQETKLDEGSRCQVAGLDRVTGTIKVLDRDAGRVVVQFALGQELPPRMSLIPFDFLPTETLERTIHEVAATYLTERRLPAALADLMDRRPPRLRGGELESPGEDAADAAVRAATRLDDSCLVIQGPPGSGKTRTAAMMILELIGQRRRVGIAAHSHKAILKLMTTCAELAGNKLDCVKVGQDDAGELLRTCLGARQVTTASKAPPAMVTGGTVWCFASPSFRGRIDTLFVDEAGQVSLADVVAMSRSTTNIVLLGDQMQLAQPLQGAHPGESGKSCLEYALQGHATIPPGRGLFLDKTHRLHPTICAFISGAVYEGRLLSRPEAERRVVEVPPGAKRIRAEAGVVYVPVEHDGNTQGSREEVEVVKEIVRELLGRRIPGGVIAEKDILVVAPYNLQVRMLQRALGPNARVGTVDKFQGQEAAIVVCSMAASDAHSSPRGMEFLLDLNRLNVALSRAQSLAILVASSHLVRAEAGTIRQVKLLNTFCRAVEAGSAATSS